MFEKEIKYKQIKVLKKKIKYKLDKCLKKKIKYIIDKFTSLVHFKVSSPSYSLYFSV